MREPTTGVRWRTHIKLGPQTQNGRSHHGLCESFWQGQPQPSWPQTRPLRSPWQHQRMDLQLSPEQKASSCRWGCQFRVHQRKIWCTSRFRPWTMPLPHLHQLLAGESKIYTAPVCWQHSIDPSHHPTTRPCGPAGWPWCPEQVRRGLGHAVPPGQVQHHVSVSQQETSGPPLHLHGHTLKIVPSVKHLGVTVQSDAGWEQYITNTCSKANWMLGFLWRNLKINSTSTKELAYKALICNNLEYTTASTVWDPHLQGPYHSCQPTVCNS